MMFFVERSRAVPKKIENDVCLHYTKTNQGPSLAEYGRGNLAVQGK